MKLLSEDISEYVDSINSVDDLEPYEGYRIVYQRTGSGINLNDKPAVINILNNIRSCGLSREFGGTNGEMYGEGLYTSLTLKDCQNNSSGYGDIILKVWLPGFNRCLIDKGCHVYGHDLATQVHGRNSSLYDQYVNLMGEKEANKLKGFTNIYSLAQYTKNSDYIFHEYDIDGIIYDWGHTGHWVCVWKDYKKAFPLEYSLDYGRTFHKLGDNNTIKCTLQTWEPTRVLGKDIKNYHNATQARVENGYMLVNNDNGYNYIDPRKGKHPVSSVWFELATPADENKVGVVKFNGKNFWYYIPEDEIYEITGDDTEEALMMDDPVGHSVDLPTITSRPAMEEGKTVFGNLLSETLDEYVPNISRDSLDNRNGDLTYFYRLSLPKQIDSIAANGFSKEFRGSGNDNSDFLGSGTYGVVFPSNGIHPNYGNILWKYATPTELVRNTYISPDPYLAKKFGIKGSFAEQLKRFFPDLYPKWESSGMLRRILAPTYSGSAMIRQLNDIAFNGTGGKSDYAYHSHGINGIIYNGNIDHNAVITFDDSTLIPVAWKDNAKPHDNWHSVEITDTLWNRTYNGFDPLPFLKGTYKDYSDNPNEISQNYRVVNGYMLVCKKDTHKYNYIKAPEGGRNFASSVWFDLASPIDENGMGTVKFNGQKFWYYAPEDEIYEIDGSDTEEALMMNDPIGHSADLPKLTSINRVDESKSVFGNLLEEILKKY